MLAGKILPRAGCTSRPPVHVRKKKKRKKKKKKIKQERNVRGVRERDGLHERCRYMYEAHEQVLG